MKFNEEYLKTKKCLIFDCDGTLADSMRAHSEAYKQAFNHYNIPFSEEEFNLHAHAGGKNLMQKMITDKGINIDTNLIINMKSEIVSDFFDKYLVPNDILINLIKEKYKDFKIAVVSNGRKKSITTIIKKIGIYDLVDVLLTAEDVVEAKPNPAPYLKALELLNINSSEAVVFEDNIVGYQAAKAANIDVVIVEINKELGEIQ